MTAAQPKLKKGNASSTGYSRGSPPQIQRLWAILAPSYCPGQALVNKP
jgi:hypothetical protein